jgi:hypothetical protein
MLGSKEACRIRQSLMLEGGGDAMAALKEGSGSVP